MSQADIESMSFEAALAELESIVGKLEKGDVELEQSIAIYERALARDQYERVVREHADSRHAAAARERLAALRTE